MQEQSDGIIDGFVKTIKGFSNRARRERQVVNSYKNIFNDIGGRELSEDGTCVLNDLYRFCYIGATDHGSDDLLLHRVSGRREVFNWIVQRVGYSDLLKLDQEIRSYEEMYEDE